MSFEKMPLAKIRVKDGKAMRDAITGLEVAGIDVRRPAGNDYQLKVTPELSYYPSKKKTYCDGDPSSKSNVSVEDLIALLCPRPKARASK